MSAPCWDLQYMKAVEKRKPIGSRLDELDTRINASMLSKKASKPVTTRRWM